MAVQVLARAVVPSLVLAPFASPAYLFTGCLLQRGCAAPLSTTRCASGGEILEILVVLVVAKYRSVSNMEVRSMLQAG
eukprot:s11_g5.t2